MASRKQPKTRRHSLDGIFKPRSVAVIGASRRRQTIGREIITNLLDGGFTGPVFPINPRTSVVHSMKCYPAVAAVPDPIDLAIIVVPAASVLKVASACAEKGVRGLVVISAGFREIGEEGLRREVKLRDLARAHGIRVIGPNCMGVINTDPAVALNGSFAAARPTEGAVGFVSQSGALGEAILADARAEGLGIAQFASIGNRVDVTAADLIEYWEHDDRVRLVLLYIESVGDPEKFTQVARRVSRKKPILAVKAGRSEAGARAASSHTGSVAGADVAADTLLHQSGVVRCSTLREMFALAAALLDQPRLRGPRVAVVTNAGGPGILATDALVSYGLEVGDLQTGTVRALRRVLPAEASCQNPVDMIASADADRYRAAIAAVVEDPSFDALLILFVSPIMIDAKAVAEAVLASVRGSKRPVVTCLMGKHRGDEAVQVLRAAGVPVFRFPEEAARTLFGMWRAEQQATRPLGKAVTRRIASARIRELLRGRQGWLDGERAEAVLRACGIPFAASTYVREPAAAVEAAHEIGYPVVLKAVSPRILHKSDIGGVVVGLETGDQVLEAARGLLQRARKLDPDTRLQVQATAPGFRELLLGMSRDPRLGPLFAIGLGGIHVEVLKDVAVRIGPLTDRDPSDMLGSLKGAALLGRFRGEPAPDLQAAGEALLRLDRLVGEFPAIQEVEINPFLLDRPGGESLAVDARLRLR